MSRLQPALVRGRYGKTGENDYPFSPVFAPVWSTLYFLIATSAWLVWRKAGGAVQDLLCLCSLTDLALNVVWSGLFSALRRPGMELIEIVFLLGEIVGTAVAFQPVSGLAFWLMVP